MYKITVGYWIYENNLHIIKILQNECEYTPKYLEGYLIALPRIEL